MTDPDPTAPESRQGLTMNDRLSTRKTPETAATEYPAVLEVDVTGDRALASVEKGDISLVVEAPAGISAAELEASLAGVPESIEKTAELFGATEIDDNAAGGGGA